MCINIILGSTQRRSKIPRARDGNGRRIRHGKGSGAGLRLSTGIGSDKINHNGSPTRVGRREGRQISSIYITATGEGELVNPIVPLVDNILLRGTKGSGQVGWAGHR